MPKKTLPDKNSFKDNSIIEDDEKNPQNKETTSQIEKSLEDFGQQIRETRIANNLSLESVSGHLHISVKILKAIEEGKPEKGPTPVFFRGLVRTYCQFLELDKTEFIDIFDKKLRELGKDEIINVETLKPVFSVRDSFPIRNLLTLVGILIVCFILYYSYFTESKFSDADNITTLKSENGELISEIETKDNSPQKTQDQIYKKGETRNNSPETENFSVIEKQQNIFESPVTKKENNEPLTLEIEATTGTWISLAIDNLDTQDHRIGTDEIKQWVANDKFILTIGNTQVVRVLLNGREIETNRNHDLLTNWIVDSNFLP